jgi:hypothetical protein
VKRQIHFERLSDIGAFASTISQVKNVHRIRRLVNCFRSSADEMQNPASA